MIGLNKDFIASRRFIRFLAKLNVRDNFTRVIYTYDVHPINVLGLLEVVEIFPSDSDNS